MNAQNLDLTATTILKSLNLALYLNSKGRMKKIPIADDEKTIHCMLLSFHTRIVLFFKCKNITNNNSS